MISLSLVTALAVMAEAVSFHQPKSQQEITAFAEAQSHILAATKTIKGKIADQQKKLDMLNSRVDASDADKAQVETEIRRLRNHQSIEYNKAIHAAIRAYGIAPEKMQGRLVVDGPLQGKVAAWIPVFDKIKPRWGQDAQGNSIPLEGPDPATTAAATYRDGQIIIGERCFNSPAYLASIIAHETVHFEQRTTTGRGDRMTHARAEMEAFSIQLSPGFGLSADESKTVNMAMQNTLNNLSTSGNGALRFASVPQEVGNPERDKQVATDNFYRSWASQASPAASELQERFAQFQRIRREEEGRRRQMESRPKGPGWRELEEWTANACGYLTPTDYVPIPVSPTPGDADYIRWALAENDNRAKMKREGDAYYRQWLLEHSVVIEKAEIDKLLVQEEYLSGCQRDLVGMFGKADGPIVTSWLVEQFDYQKGGGALGAILRGIGKTISSGVAVIAKAVTVPFIAIGEVGHALSSSQSADNSSESGRPSRDRSEDRERPSRSSELGGAAYNHCIDSGNTCLHH